MGERASGHRLLAAIALVVGLAGATPIAAASRGYPVGGFDRVRSSGPFTVTVRTGAAPAVRATGEPEQLDRLEIAVVGGELRIGTKPGWNWHDWSWRSRRPAVIEVIAPALRAAALTGSGDVTIDRVRTREFDADLTGSGDLVLGQVQAERARFSLTGSGDLSASGRANAVDLSVQGSGDLRLVGLAVQDATVRLMGSGDIAVTAARTARVNLLGSGDVRIMGGARCQIIKRGSGDVTCG